MIHPQMATMLAVLTTDYPLEAGEAHAFLQPAVDASFNAITVDGDCSTNDAVVLLANGASGVERTPESDTAVRRLRSRRCAASSRSRSSPTARGASVVAEIAGPAVRRATAKRARSPSASPRRHSSRRRSSATTPTGAGSRPLPARRSSPTASQPSIPTCSTHLRSTRCPGLRRRRADPGTSPCSRTASCAIEIDLALGDGSATYLTTDLSYDYVKHQRGVPHVILFFSRSAAPKPGGGIRAAGRTDRRRARRRPADLAGDGTPRSRAAVRPRPARDDA